MKKMILTLMFCLTLVPLAVQAREENSVDPEIAGLSKRLELTDQQEAALQETFAMAQSQAELDRGTFKSSPLALIAAAGRRREAVDGRIVDILSEEQKELFEAYKVDREKNEEFFILKEGLLLTMDQGYRVRAVLDEYNNKMEAYMERMKALMEKFGSGMDGPGAGGGMKGGGGMGGGGMRGGGKGGGGMRGGGMGGGMGGGGMRGGGMARSNPLDPLKELEKKKHKEIKKVLFKAQRKPYKEVRELLERRFEAKLAEMRPGAKDRRSRR